VNLIERLRRKFYPVASGKIGSPAKPDEAPTEEIPIETPARPKDLAADPVVGPHILAGLITVAS
jgi:hypothetical protein